MGLKYILVAITFFSLFCVSIGWIITNFYFFIIEGTEFILHGKNFAENIYYSVYLKWILLADISWILGSFVFMLQRKDFKTNPKLHYLNYKKIENPEICVVIPTYNEQATIEKVVRDFISQKYVKYVIIIDNNSDDETAKIAEKNGAIVVRKKKNEGFAHSYTLGCKEALKTDANVIVTTEAGDTYNAYDISKMLSYLENCDMVVGSRQNQLLTEKGNQNSILHVWGNLLLAKLIQLKYFNLLHLGFVNLTDVGCVYRIFKREYLERIVNKLTYQNSDQPIAGLAISLHITILAIENDFRIMEIPVTFKKRIDKSKLGSDKKLKAIKYGLIYLWFILKT